MYRSLTTIAASPWSALWAMLVGFFMILVDASIVAVANPSIMVELGADYDAVIWVTSAYLLAYAVPLLVAGRLGDRFGPKNVYLLGLAVFTAASLWCGLSDTIGMLVAARVLQGVGAALLTPQTLSVITRLFPADRRGMAMSLWGATAGVATLVGPLAGGVLIDGLGWQWIFFVNVPLGILGLGLAVWLIPDLGTQMQRFDLPGVALSAVGMFMIVFALQEGQANAWAPWVWGLLAGGVGVMAAFLIWQYVNPDEPLIPLVIFRDRDFSLSNLGVATIGFVVTAMLVPVMFYAQAVCGLSPTRSALLLAPMAIMSGVLAPFVGKIVDRVHPRPVIGFGFSLVAIAMTWLSVELTPTTPIWRVAVPLTVTGVGMAFIWSPLAATATRNLPSKWAGAGSGIYNTTRQVGSVLGSAGMAAFMTWRIDSEMSPSPPGAPRAAGAVTHFPPSLQEPFSAAMSQTLLLPAFLALFGVCAALFLLGFGRGRPAVFDDDPGDLDRDAALAVEYGGDEFFAADHDDYVEYTISWDEPARADDGAAAAEPTTEPIAVRAPHVLPAPGTEWHWEQRRDEQASEPEDDPESWRDILDILLADDPALARPTAVESIGFAHNGFHVDDEQRFQPLQRPHPTVDSASGGPARHRSDEAQPPPRHRRPDGRHYRADPDEPPRHGRHSSPRHGRHSSPWHD
ncbi:DHA2 family efflux MFS transporter permease subunit [Mycolicibacterium sp. XJ1819]